MHAMIASLNLALLTLTELAAAQTVSLFGGRHVQLFKNTELSRVCAVALATPLRCPSLVQRLTYPEHALNLTLPTLESFCSSSCQTDIQDVADRLGLRCAEDVVDIQIGSISFAEFGDFVRHRSEMLCLKESSEGRFCQEVRGEWDISDDSTDLTWPEHTSKCWKDESTGECFVEEDPFEDFDSDAPKEIPAWMFPPNDFAGEDYFRNRSGVLEGAKRHSLGSSEDLDWDEYPLEIQCNRCFWKTFAMGLENEWGHMRWDSWTEQTWANMVLNCDIRGEDAIITPAKNLTEIELPPSDGEDETDWDLCPDTITIPDDNADSIWEFAQKASLPMACLRSFNSDEYYLPESLRGQKLCVPLTCETAVVDEIMPVQNFVENHLEGVTFFQFLTWNKCLSRSSVLLPHDTVCLGPHRGSYVPTVTGVASSTVFTTTATPAATARPAPLTIRNCGLFHVITDADTCTSLSLRYSVTVHMLRNMNPMIDSECANLFLGRSYCVAPVNGTEVPDVTTTYAPTQLAGTSTGTAAPRVAVAPSGSTTASADS